MSAILPFFCRQDAAQMALMGIWGEAEMRAVFLNMWFCGRMEGAQELTEAQRAKIFRCCAERCASSYPLEIYRKAYAKPKRRVPSFFAMLGSEEGIQMRQRVLKGRYGVHYARRGSD